LKYPAFRSNDQGVAHSRRCGNGSDLNKRRWCNRSLNYIHVQLLPWRFHKRACSAFQARLWCLCLLGPGIIDQPLISTNTLKHLFVTFCDRCFLLKQYCMFILSVPGFG